MDQGIFTNSRRFFAIGLVAGSTLLVAACDSATPEADVDTSMRTASAPRVAVDLAPGDGESWAVLDTGEVLGWGRRYCTTTECSEPSELAPIDLDGPAVQVQSNGHYTAVLMADATVLGWGDGVSDTADPEPVSFGDAVAELAMGEDFLCARLDDGRVECQGIEGAPTPAWVDDLESSDPMVEISAGRRHLCGRNGDGAVTCWGANDAGQLGAAGVTGSNPIALSNAATELAAGGEHTCARLTTGAVECWGSNTDDQLGHGSAGVDTVSLPEPVERLAAGAAHSCAVAQTSGVLYCWGGDAEGQLGTGTDLSGIRRVDLGTLAAVEVFAGPTARTTFVVLDDEGLRGWGLADVGQTGYGDEQTGGSTIPGDLPDILIFRAPD